MRLFNSNKKSNRSWETSTLASNEGHTVFLSRNLSRVAFFLSHIYTDMSTHILPGG